jgi:hypothetical protein
LLKRGYTALRFQEAVIRLYTRNQWKTYDGEFSVWELVRKYHKQAILNNDYFPVNRRKMKDYHPITAEAVAQQKRRLSQSKYLSHPMSDKRIR